MGIYTPNTHGLVAAESGLRTSDFRLRSSLGFSTNSISQEHLRALIFHERRRGTGAKAAVRNSNSGHHYHPHRQLPVPSFPRRSHGLRRQTSVGTPPSSERFGALGRIQKISSQFRIGHLEVIEHIAERNLLFLKAQTLERIRSPLELGSG